MSQRAYAEAKPSLLRRLNEQRVLEAVQTGEAVSRAEIARTTGISAPTVSKAVTALIRASLIEEGAMSVPGAGRPARVLRMARTSAALVGVEIGPRQCRVATAGLDGKLHDDGATLDTPAAYRDLIDAVADEAARQIRGCAAPVLAVGVSVPGLLRRREGRTLVSPNLHQTDGHRIGADLRRRLDLPVTLIHETSALCAAERAWGAARGIDHFAMLDFSGGLGLGVVVDGHLLEGVGGLAGEIGHTTVNPAPDAVRCGCGNRGCLETEATDAALAAAVSRRLGRGGVEVAEAVALAADDRFAADVERVLQFAAIGVAAVVNIFNPQRVFVHSQLLAADDRRLARLLELTEGRALAAALADCRIVRARGAKLQGALAAAIRSLSAVPAREPSKPTLHGATR